jgi:hypothetical protein
MPVTVGPGAMPFTKMPYVASSSAACRTSWPSAAFEATYSVLTRVSVCINETVVVTMMRPAPCRFMIGTAACNVANAPRRFTLTTRSKVSSDRCSNAASSLRIPSPVRKPGPALIPALANNTSNRPDRASTAATAACTDSGFVTSPPLRRRCHPLLATAPWPRSARRDQHRPR